MRAIDGLLMLMVAIWATNYSVIKRAFEEIPPQPFNAVRLAFAAGLYLIAIDIARRRARRRPGRVSSVFYTPYALTRADRWTLLWVGLVGHLCYQSAFVEGVNGTSVSNAALIIGATPAVVAVASALLGRDSITRLHWIGAGVSAMGIYIVVGHGASFGGQTWHGDALVLVSVCCWAAYTLGAAGLMARHSPLYVTGVTMAIGAVPYAVLTLPQVLRVDWLHLSMYAMFALPLSGVFALCVGYLIWYAGVQRLGPARTSIYSNVVPIAGMLVARVWLGEPLTPAKVAGAAAIVSGVLLTRLGRRTMAVPAEE